MTLAEATARAMKAVLGGHLAEYQKAKRAFSAGALLAEQFEPMRRDFMNALERRQDTIAHEVKLLMRPRALEMCAAPNCQMSATTVVAGRDYCDGHAATAPRLPVPAGRAA